MNNLELLDNELTGYLCSALRTLPGDLGDALAVQAVALADKRDAEINALLQAPQNVKNAEGREMQRKQTLLNRPSRQAARRWRCGSGRGRGEDHSIEISGSAGRITRSEIGRPHKITPEE